MEETDISKPEPAPEWLKHLQRNSWEPEVIISGISLAIIFAFPAQIFNFAIFLIQDFGIPFVGAWLILLYTSFAINVLKIFFTMHLILRFSWAALLGVSYAFPDGVNPKNLFKSSIGITFSHPTDLVLRLERICSLAFAFPLILGLSIVLLSGYLIFLLALYSIFNLSFSVIYVTFLVSLLLFALGITQIKRFPTLSKRFGKSLFATVGALYQSNLGKWSVLGYSFGIIVFAIPFVAYDTAGFRQFFHETSLSEESVNWPDTGSYYADEAQSENRFARIQIPSRKMNGQLFSVNLAFYATFASEIEKINASFADTASVLGFKTLEKPTDLFRFYIQEKEVFPKGWQPLLLANSRQKVYSTVFDLSELQEGPHVLTVKRIVYLPNFLFTGEIIRLRETWAVVPFYKE